jgi:hypothetical protein
MRKLSSDFKSPSRRLSNTSMTAVAFFLVLFALTSVQAAFGTKSGAVFLEAQRCRVNGTVDYACFQQKMQRFEQFVLEDNASWMQKSIVAESIVKTYDALHMTTPLESSVRAKQLIYLKAFDVLDVSERGQIGDCKDETNPDSCLKNRYCFREAYIKVKNVLVTNEPERFKPEILWFDRGIQTGC